jgi:hypothetical protein
MILNGSTPSYLSHNKTTASQAIILAIAKNTEAHIP